MSDLGSYNGHQLLSPYMAQGVGGGVEKKRERENANTLVSLLLRTLILLDQGPSLTTSFKDFHQMTQMEVSAQYARSTCVASPHRIPKP